MRWEDLQESTATHWSCDGYESLHWVRSPRKAVHATPSVTISCRHSLAANALTQANCHCIAVTVFNTTHKQSTDCVPLQKPTTDTNIQHLWLNRTIRRNDFYFLSLHSSLIGTTTTMKSLHKTAGGKPEGKIPFGRPRCRWVDRILNRGPRKAASLPWKLSVSAGKY